MNPVTIHVHAEFATAVEPSPRVCQVAAMFGLGVDQRRSVTLIPPTDLSLAPHQIIFITGASGGGKTTLLRRIAAALGCVDARQDCKLKIENCKFQIADQAALPSEICNMQFEICNFQSCLAPHPGPLPGRERGPEQIRLIDFAALGEAPDLPLVESLPGSLEDAVRWLALAGLNDAFVMLRKFSQLSDGQRYRFQLARAMAEAEGNCGLRNADCGMGEGAAALEIRNPQSAIRNAFTVVLADEFGATLDRLTAKVIARNVRKWTRKAPVCFIAATTHDDLLEPLDPDTLIVQHPGESMEILKRGD